MKSIGTRPRPELLRLMLRRLGKRHGSVSWESPTDFTWLLARTSVLRPGYMAPSFLTSAQSCSWLSVICSRRSDGQDVRASDTELKPFRHRKSSSSLDGETAKRISSRRKNAFQATPSVCRQKKNLTYSGMCRVSMCTVFQLTCVLMRTSLRIRQKTSAVAGISSTLLRGFMLRLRKSKWGTLDTMVQIWETTSSDRIRGHE